ncbi:MAG: HD domain-containing protein [Lachnospiraceae bacterium]|nr:HD domain-containing protein [Lachnospiraceae bacterium]
MTVSDAIIKMISISEGNEHDINHFLKVWGYARTIGEAEKLDERTLKTLELAAVVHDIACPSLRKEHGSAPGGLQEKAGPDLVREFFSGSNIDADMLERICFLVGHHHTYKDVDGLDHQILLEADFLVNAGEQENDRKAVRSFHENVFRTQTGLALLENIYILSTTY